MSVIGNHAVKKLEKLMAWEAKADEANIKHALKDVKKAEKAVKKSAKVRSAYMQAPAALRPPTLVNIVLTDSDTDRP